MTPRYPGALFISILLHVGLAGLLLFMAYAFKPHQDEAVQVFEVVDGEGDNYDALEAPALGSPEGTKVDIDIPELPAMAAAPEPEPTPDPLPPTPEVISPAPPEPKPQPAPTVKVTIPKPKPAPKPKPTTATKTMSKAEFDRQNKTKSTAAQKTGSKSTASTSKGVRIDAKGIAQGVKGGSTANTTGGAGGKALSRAEQDRLGTYFAALKLRLKQNHEKPDGLSDLLTARVAFLVAADGSLSRARITRTSGNAEFDQSVLDAVARTRGLGARPDGKSDMVEVEIKMRDEG